MFVRARVCARSLFITKDVVGALLVVDIFAAGGLFWSMDVSAHKPVQPFAPELEYADAQSPHFIDPTVLMHLRLLSQPPLFVAHSFTSKRVCVHALHNKKPIPFNLTRKNSKSSHSVRVSLS